MKSKILLYSIFLSMLVSHSYGQKGRIKAANEKYDRYIYIDAIKIYERVAEKGYKDEKMFQRLGNAYYFNGELAQAEKWYSELFAMNQEQDTEYYYRYAQTLKAISNYDKADKTMNEFSRRLKNDRRSKLYVDQKDYLDNIKAISHNYDVSDAGINSKYSDYGSSFLNNNLVFATALDSSGKICKWTNQPFTNLYTSEIKPSGAIGKPEPFSKIINSKFHESTPVFTKNGKTMYFTRNNYLNGKKGKDSKSTTLLKLYKAVFKEGEWKDVTELPFNSNEYSTAHPALSLNEKTLYFASNMPGTLGQSDLYSVAINDDGSFGNPVNLGASINTEGRETFPFVGADNELYFASDGRPGLGGLDIFVAKIVDDSKFEDVKNIGEPVNSPQDDFAFIADEKTQNGFFTSNRDGGKGYDDIYRFKEIVYEKVIFGLITDRGTGIILPGSKVSLFNEEFKLITDTIADEKGLYEFKVEPGKEYYIRAEKENYETTEEKITIDNKKEKTEFPIQLDKIKKPVKEGTDLAKILDITVIYFDLDKSFIRKDAAFELEKILTVMQEHPNLKIEIRSHTDSRQTQIYNEKLSERRARSTVSWLIKKGIKASRLTSKGYGETQLINGCSDGVPCNEQEHQANRRSEFIIVSM